MSDFPSSKFERSKIFTQSGLKVGGNYAKYHLKKVFNKDTGTEAKSTLHRQNATTLFSAFTKLRGTALKIAQSISVDNSGILPDEFMEIMAQAQYSVPPINKALVRSIIKQELKHYPEQVFRRFELDAMAAASIGQVHRAEHADFGTLAVKIQYPNVRETISSDLSMAKLLFKQLVSSAKTEDYFQEVRARLLEETDYTLEGKHLAYFHGRYNQDKFATPRWIPELSTQRVLSMEFIEGVHLGEFLARNPSQDERDHFGQLIWDFFHEQINEEHTIHADTHPGNFLFMPDGRLGILDFGCVKTFPEFFFKRYMMALPLHKEHNEAQLRVLYTDLEILKPDETDSTYFDFFNAFGKTFIKPYQHRTFDFSDTHFKDELSSYLKQATSFQEPVGSEHFIYASKVHMGLYNMLMQLKARIHTEKSYERIEAYLRMV